MLMIQDGLQSSKIITMLDFWWLIRRRQGPPKPSSHIFTVAHVFFKPPTIFSMSMLSRALKHLKKTNKKHIRSKHIQTATSNSPLVSQPPMAQQVQHDSRLYGICFQRHLARYQSGMPIFCASVNVQKIYYHV